MNIDQSQQADVLGGNIQDGIPQQQGQPSLIINEHYLPNGDMTLASNLSYIDSSVYSIIVPLVKMPDLFEQKFDNTETNFSDSDNIEFSFNKYSPGLHAFIPNIARYIGYVITGQQLESAYLQSILVCCRNYLDGTMELLPSGTFRTLIARRDGTTRRYSNMCKSIYFAISSQYDKVRPNQSVVVKAMQELFQDIYADTTYTSVFTILKPYVVDNTPYSIGTTALCRWATSIPWHALIYNSQSPLSFNEFIDLFFKMYSIQQGKALRYDAKFENRQMAQSIIPNSNLFTKLEPEGMNSCEVHITADIPNSFITFMRYMMQSEDSGLPWEDDESSDDNDDDDGNDYDAMTDELGGAESVDETELAY